MALIIGIMGPAGVGKDTAADHLVKRHGFVKMSLADEMKRICKRVYGFSDLQLWGASQFRNAADLRYPRNDGSYLSPRIALQVLGTEFGRTCYENTWVDLTIRDAKNVLAGFVQYNQRDGITPVPSAACHLHRAPYGVVIPDCRFRNEVEAVRKAGGIVIRLKRETAVDSLQVGVKGHVSEAEQRSIPDSDLDYVLDVQDGIENFQHQLDVLLGDIQARRIVTNALKDMAA